MTCLLARPSAIAYIHLSDPILQKKFVIGDLRIGVVGELLPAPSPPLEYYGSPPGIFTYVHIHLSIHAPQIMGSPEALLGFFPKCIFLQCFFESMFAKCIFAKCTRLTHLKLNC